MPTPQIGQKTIPLTDWNRFLRVADWWDRTHGHKPPSVLPPKKASVTVTIRQGKLDSPLIVGGKATVSVWWNAYTNDYLENVNEDSGEDLEDCLSPFAQLSAYPAGTRVSVLSVDGKNFILHASCP